MFKKKILALLLMLAVFPLGSALADTVQLNPDHPDRYVVVKGDTLWDISAKFLKDPWYWPEIWHINPAIENPHLIYPGDEIFLRFVDGKPVLELNRGRPTVILKPHARSTKLEEAIPTIPLDAIKQFLTHPRIISREELDSSGYIVAGEEGRLISATSNKVYVRGIENSEHEIYQVFREGKVYRNPGAKMKDILGYEAIHVADARLEKTGDPATFQITSSNREVLVGDRLLPAADGANLNLNFQPHAPTQKTNGQIISVLDGVSRIGQFQIVVLNLGKRQQIETGHVLGIFQSGDVVRDNIDSSRGRNVKLPDERAGTLMVIQPYERVSYALVMEATKAIRLYDMVSNP